MNRQDRAFIQLVRSSYKHMIAGAVAGLIIVVVVAASL